MREHDLYRRLCAMCREVFGGFRATWTDICADCEPRVRAHGMTYTEPNATARGEGDTGESDG